LIVRSLRRGNSASHPTCLAFNYNGTLLATASVSGSVHVFSNPADEWKNLVEHLIKGDTEKPPAPAEQQSFISSTWSWVKQVSTSAISAATPYVMKSFDSSYYSTPQTRVMCGWGLTDGKSKNILVIVESDGSFSSHDIISRSKISSFKTVEMTVSDGSATGPQMLRGPLPEGSVAPAPAPAPVAAVPSGNPVSKPLPPNPH